MKIPEGIYRLEEPGMAAFLFSGRREVMADACLQGMMGCVYGTAGGMDSAAAVLGDFCFLAGKPEERLIAWDYGRQYLLLAPPDAAWRELIKKVLGDRAREHTRYAIKKRGTASTLAGCGPWRRPFLRGSPFPGSMGSYMENALRRNGAGTWFPAFPPVRRMKPRDWGWRPSGETSCWQEPPPMPGAGTPLRSRSIPGRI